MDARVTEYTCHALNRRQRKGSWVPVQHHVLQEQYVMSKVHLQMVFNLMEQYISSHYCNRETTQENEVNCSRVDLISSLMRSQNSMMYDVFVDR